jgi:hypothetical protein
LPDSKFISFCGKKKETKEKSALPPLISFIAAPNAGRLAQRALTSHTKRGLLRSLNGARRLSRLVARASGASEGDWRYCYMK